MAGSKLGIFKGKTGFGKKGYKPGAMITKMNKGNKSLKGKKVATKKVIKKTI